MEIQEGFEKVDPDPSIDLFRFWLAKIGGTGTNLAFFSHIVDEIADKAICWQINFIVQLSANSANDFGFPEAMDFGYKE